MVTIASEIERRDVNPHQVLLATMLALMREHRILSYVIVCGAMSDVGRKLAAIYGRHDSVAESIPKLVNLLDVGKFEVAEEGSHVVFRLKADTCCICPKGVGGLAIPEKLCPLVGLFAGFAGIEYQSEKHRRQGECYVIELGHSKEKNPY